MVREIGVFDDLYLNYFEDVDSCLRARRARFDVGVAPEAAIHHHLSHSESELGGQRRHLTERNRIRTLLKYFPLGRFLRWMRNEWRHERKVCRDGKVRAIRFAMLALEPRALGKRSRVSRHCEQERVRPRLSTSSHLEVRAVQGLQ